VRRSLFVALILVIWLGLDFQSLLMSVLGTYFFFGLEGTPYHGLKIGLVALLTISGPVIYWRVFLRREVRGELGVLLGLELAAYLLCAYVRQSDVFAWATVFGRLVSGVAIVSVLRRLREFSCFEIPVLGILLALLVYLWARVVNDGLLVAVHPTGAFVAVLGALFLLALVPGRRPEAASAPVEKPVPSLQLSTVGFVLLLDVGLVLLCNINLWSAKTPAVHASVYICSFGLGAAAGFLDSWCRSTGRSLLATAAAGMGFALFVVLQLSYGIRLGLFAHFCGCYGLTVFCALFVRRFKRDLDTRPGALPIAGLQVGSTLALLAFGAFLLTANPASFWAAFGIGMALLCAVEMRRPIEAAAGVPFRRALAWSSLFLVAMLPVVLYQAEDAEPPTADVPELTVMTTNARYGWTDDYRFDPDPYVRWLQGHPAAIIGMQEVNKGSFYGGFTDVFEYYRTRLPGRAIYGDANFGFGNALFTGLEIVDSRVTAFASNAMIRRSFIWALVKYGGREIEVFVAHLAYLPHPNEIRQSQVRELVERLARTERPWILMGDMNALPDDPEIAAFAEVAHPVFRERLDLFAENTYPSARPRVRLDYVFFSNHFDLVDQTVLDNRGAADHRPIRSVLRLAR